jgi:hypothetical protein
MRKFAKTAIVPILALFLLAPVHAAEKMDHGHGTEGAASHEAQEGKKIRETMIDGHHLTYRLIDMKERMKDMKDMPEMDATHHLMVFIKTPAGENPQSAKVGYLVEGPHGSTQKAMTMAMAGGFGADVDLSKKGIYAIKTKAVADDAKLIDSFTHTVQ